MPRRIITIKCRNGDPYRLDEFLVARLPDSLPASDSAITVTKSKLRRLIVAGAISLNGQATRNPAASLQSGASIQIRWDAERFAFEKPNDDIDFTMSAERIVYEDEWIVVVDKPAGLPSEATMVSSRNHLHKAVRDYLAKRDGIPEPYVGQHHRLDRETSGLLLYSKHPSVNPNLHQLFLGHALQKTYLALTGLGRSQKNDTFSVINTLARISPKSQAAKWGFSPGGQSAHTDFEVMQKLAGGWQIKALPRTGRTHQIRVHLASVGLAILGDSFYGGASQLGDYRVSRVMLHAQGLEFPHPYDGRILKLQADIPVDFQQCLMAMKRLSGR